MQRTTELLVDNRRYVTTQYSATKGLTLLTRLAKVIGKPLGILALQRADQAVTPDLVGMLIESITSQIDENEVVTLVNDILRTTETFDADGKHRPIILDTDFAGSYGHLLKLIREVLSFQYGDFFGVAVGTIEKKPEGTTATRMRARG